MARGFAWCVGGVLVLVACVGNESSPPLVDASTSSSSSSGAATSSDAAAGASVATYDEELGCSGWDGDTVFSTESNPHGGTNACRACWNKQKDDAGNGYVFANRVVQAPITVGKTYAVTAFLRNVSDQPALDNVRLVLLGISADESELDSNDNQLAPTKDWALVGTDLEIADPKTKSLLVRIQAHQPDGQSVPGCLAFDDIVVVEK